MIERRAGWAASFFAIAVTASAALAQMGPGNGPGGGGPGGGGGGMGPGGGMGGGPGGNRRPDPVDNTPRTLDGYFTKATSEPKSPDPDGFLQRWLLLEPIHNNLRGNSGFNNAYLQQTLKADYFPNQFTVIPKDGDQVTVGDEKLTWHALDAKDYNVKLFRLAYGLNKPVYGVLFWGVTVVNAPREMKDVRLATGTNSASMWWLNGEQVSTMTGDRRMVADDVISKRLTLKKGPNVLRFAVINGPGMSDMCCRFLDEEGKPVTDLKLTLEAPQQEQGSKQQQ